MLPAVGRRISTDGAGKGLNYEFPMSVARKILLDLVFADHTYSKAPSLDPEFNRIHSTSLLFSTPEEAVINEDDIIDIEGVGECKEAKLNYDEEAGRMQMSELEQCYKAMLEMDGWQEDDQIIRLNMKYVLMTEFTAFWKLQCTAIEFMKEQIQQFHYFSVC